MAGTNSLIITFSIMQEAEELNIPGFVDFNVTAVELPGRSFAEAQDYIACNILPFRENIVFEESPWSGTGACK